MLLGIDHIVIAVHDPDAAAAELERVAGLSGTGGGRHSTAGTFNRLAFLGDAYLELIGVFDADLVVASPSFAVGTASLALLRRGHQGLATWSLASDDVASDVERLWATGSSSGEPGAGSRMRPDGEVVRWVTAFPAIGPARPPFLIEHAYEGAEWGDAARAGRAAFRHAGGGAVRLGGLRLAVPDPEATAAAISREVGLALDAVPEHGERRFRTIVGPHAVELRGIGRGRARPIVDLLGEPGTPLIDVVRFGVRWRRRPSA
jgi:hypothetical protein